MRTTKPYVPNTDPVRQAKVSELNRLQREWKEKNVKLEKMEAHEGDDGTPEDVDGQCALVEEMAVMMRRIRDLRREVYPS